MKKIPLRNPLKRFKNRVIATTALAAAGLLLAAVACGSDTAPPSRGVTVSPTPDAQATITALARRAEVGTPTPTIVPAADRGVAVAFADGHKAISEDWDKLHGDLDAWRAGLVSCTANAVQSSLGGFAGRFAGITESARALPRPSVVRELADTLIQAAEQEETALRLLRDSWQAGTATISPASSQEDEDSGEPQDSNNPTAASLFEGVDLARSGASVLRKQVDDALSDLAEKTTDSSLEEASTFSTLFSSLDTAWDQFHLEYDALRSQLRELSPEGTSARLGLLVDQFRNIANAARGLPSIGATREVAELLAQTAQEEDLALRKLRGTAQDSAQKSEEPSNESSGDEVDSTGEGVEGEETGTEANGTGAGSSAGNAGTVDGAPFDEFDTQLVTSNSERLVARRLLEQIVEDTSEETEAIVAEFTGQYNLLLRDWDDFHEEYDQWRRTEGGCDRAAAVETLGRFTVAIGKIANDVRNLPAATVLRPMGELLVEAAGREERALRDLGNTWQPHDTGVYATLDQERTAANKLRRQVTVGLQELFERFGIPP